MEMKVTGYKPVGDGKQTEITVTMSSQDAERFLDLYSRGELAHLGLLTAEVVDPAPNKGENAAWASDVRPQRGTGPRDRS